jgi:hypothetical protein
VPPKTGVVHEAWRPPPVPPTKAFDQRFVSFTLV